jgi:hypothetical protein
MRKRRRDKDHNQFTDKDLKLLQDQMDQGKRLYPWMNVKQFGTNQTLNQKVAK